ncbi:MAG TPA: cobalamin biosynthesis protein CbiG, partial [Paenibacillaceae bacterium]|nr:cobalamin biosynthesis protein CbiG [Paenibacillaceae bacterium]
ILFISLGAVVRMIAPLLKDKKTDPGVVVVDDQGQFAISMLSGHLGGANELAREVANLTGAQAVVTTASDVQKTIPVDLLGQRFGWMWDEESEGNLTPASAAVVNGEKVAIVQESGEKDWWMHDTPMPANLTMYKSVGHAIESNPHSALVITHRILSEEEKDSLPNLVVYRPKSIILGVGCNRGTEAEEIEMVIKETLEELGFSLDSVKAIGTIDLKKDEEGLLQVCNKYGWKFVYYKPEELNEIPIEEPSDVVYRYTGAYGVSEPACKKYAGIEKLAVTKKKSGNVTLSVGIIP